MIYTTGTISIDGNTATGTGTNWTAAGSLIRVGCTVIVMSSPAQVFQITAVNSATGLTVSPAASPALSGQKYAILLSDSLTVDGLAQDIAETFRMYQSYMGGFADVMNGAGDVTITINGEQVTVPGQKSLAKKGANEDITSLSGLTTPLSIQQGGTGGGDLESAKASLGIKSISDSLEKKMNSDSDTIRAFFTSQYNNDKIELPGVSTYSNKPWGTIGQYGFVLTMSNGVVSGQTDAGVWYSYLMIDTAGRGYIAGNINKDFIGPYALYSTQNTSVDSGGFIKRASPVVKLFSDGTFETNEESAGATVERLSTGVYKIDGCWGLNSDAAWGGTDGGFDVPQDRNKQPLVWLDYEVQSDGAILVKTYHRTHPAAPVFAQNIKEGYADGDPIDIPADQFLSVRVQMPENSIWNQRQAQFEETAAV